MDRSHGALAAVLLLACLVSAASAAACSPATTGTTPFFGAADSRAANKYANQGARWEALGDITKLQLYYSPDYGCVFGLKATYGYALINAALMGLDRGMYTQGLVLTPGEKFTFVDYKAGGKCIEYLKLTTDRGRTLAIGDANSATPTTSAAANSPGAYLTTFRGWTDSAGALQQLQIVWGTRCAPAGAAASPSPAAAFAESGPKPSPAAAAASPKPAVASPKPSPVAAAAASSKPAAASPKLSPATAVSSPKPSAARPKPAAAASPALAASSPAAAAAAAASPSPAGVPAAAAACAPRPDMCSETEAGLLNMCKAVSPFTSPKCVGGCCVSSGRCRFGSCLANGLGLDVPMACFGYNNIPKPFGLAPGKCAYLACKLAVPGCKTPLLGGSCVGAVALAPGSDASKLSANSAQYIGRPCVETTPTGGLVTLPSLGISNSEYVLAGWKACDCADVQILPKLNLTGLLPHITLPANPLTDVVAKISNETSKLMHRGAASASPSPSPSSGSGSAEAEGGDASLGAASGLGALKDLVMGAKSSAADPFSDFLSDDAAASPAPTADDASAAA